MRAARPPWAVGSACEVLHKERGAVYVLWCKEDRGQRERCMWHWQRGPREAGAARVALRAQQHCFCVMFVSPSRLWVRARAGAWMLAVCEDERADGNAAEDGGVDWSPCTWQQGMVLGQAPRQRVGDECRRRLMSMLPCAMGSSAAPSAALAAATERPTVSAVSAAIVEWGVVPQTPTATTTSGSKVHECGSLAPGMRRAIEAHGFRRSHGSYLACLRPIAT